jgi:hypothetical protein
MGVLVFSVNVRVLLGIVHNHLLKGRAFTRPIIFELHKVNVYGPSIANF